EDILSWLLVLRDWRPNSFDTSLIRLLDKTELTPASEETAETLLATVSSKAFRELFHIPPEHQLRNEFFPDELVRVLEQALPANLDGLRLVVRTRRENDRARVTAYNKIKHVFLAFPET